MNCLLYARVSTDKQAQKELSIPAQIEAMKEYARRNRWKIAGHFVDSGESAKTANRPELQRLIHYCQENEGVEVVLVHKLDRLARNLIDHATITTIFRRKGIRLVSVCEPIEDTPAGKLMENFLASMSEYYSANLGSEIRKGNMAKLRKGEWPHKPPAPSSAPGHCGWVALDAKLRGAVLPGNLAPREARVVPRADHTFPQSHARPQFVPATPRPPVPARSSSCNIGRAR